MALGLIVAIVLTTQHDIKQTQSEEIYLSLANRVHQQRGGAVVKVRQHFGSGIRNISVTPDNFGEVIASQTNFEFLWAIQILHDRIRRARDVYKRQFHNSVQGWYPFDPGCGPGGRHIR